MDFQIRCKRPHGRKRLPGAEFTADESFLRGEYHLIEDGLAGLKSQPERCHTNNVTRVTRPVKNLYRRSGKGRIILQYLLPCPLIPDPAQQFDFLTNAGAQIIVFAKNDSDTAHIIACTLNGAPQTIDAQNRACLAAVPGRNLVNLAFVAADPVEEFQIMQDCGGVPQILGNWSIQQGPTTPGGPTRAYRIYAS